MADVFVSYSRRDQDFVRRLHAALVAAGREVWVDWEGIPPSAKWMDEVRSAIDAADAFVFVVSPDSAASPVCRDEAEHALAVGKRIVPLVRRDTPEHTLPEAISAHNWLTLREGDDFEAGFARLLAALDTDLEWVKEHTRLVTRARDWEASGRERSRLLRGRDLGRAEQAIARADRDPRPTPLQTSYVLASREAERRGARIRSALLSGGLVVALVLAGFALLQRSEAQQNASLADQQRQVAEEQRGEAETQRSAAEAQRAEAETQATLAKARELTAASNGELEHDPELSLLLARRAVDLVNDPTTDRALRQALEASAVRARFAGHDGPVESVDVSDDGTRLLSAADDDTLRVWDLATGAELKRLRPEVGRVRAGALSPDGRLVAAGLDNGSVMVWDAETGAVRTTVHAHPRQVREVTFSPDSRRLLSLGWEGQATLLDLQDGSSITVPDHATTGLVAGAFSPDGTRFVTAGLDSIARVWSLDGQLQAELVGHTRTIWNALFTVDGTRLITASSDETIRIWDLATSRATQVVRGHESAVVALAIAPDGATFASGGADGTVRLWQTASGRQLATLRGHDGPVNDIAFAPDGSTVYSAGGDQTIRAWAIHPFAPLAEYAGHIGGVTAGAFTPDGSKAVVVGGDTYTILYDAETGTPLRTMRGHTFEVWSVDLDADGGRILTGAEDGTARIWETATGTELHVLQDADAGHVHDVRFSPDGRLAATADDTGAVVWDADSGNRRQRLSSTEPIVSVAFAADGRTLFTGNFGGALLRWDLADGEEEDLGAAVGKIISLDLSPDGKQLAVLGEDAGIEIRDTSDGHLIRRWRTPYSNGWSIHWSPDGTQLVTGGDDGAAHIWDAWDMELLADLPTPSRDVFNAVFGPQPSSVLVMTRDGDATLVRCDLCGSHDQVVALAANRVTRDLTADELVAFVHEQPQAAPAPSRAPVETPNPDAVPEPPAVAVDDLCNGIEAPCPVDARRYQPREFEPSVSFVVERAGSSDGQTGGSIGIGFENGDYITLMDSRLTSANEQDAAVPIGSRAADWLAYLRRQEWLKLSDVHEIEVDGHRGFSAIATSDVESDVLMGYADAFAWGWRAGATTSFAAVDVGDTALVVSLDKGDEPVAEFKAFVDRFLSSIRFTR